MKLYSVVLDDGRTEDVVADSYMVVDEKYVFFTDGKPIADIFFREQSVQGINLVQDPFAGFRWRGGGSY
jgi:hypothetical protein